MKYKFASDSHTHSDCSPDGASPAAQMVHRAEELGLYALTLTDHCECQKYDEKYRAVSEKAWDIMSGMQPGGALRFYKGIELGQPLENLAAAQEAAGKFDYDFIIGSLHNLRGRQDFYYYDCGTAGIKQIHSVLFEYWEQLLEMIEWGGFDSLGHLTYPLRYIQGENGVYVDMARHRDYIDRVLGALVKKGIALEVNTSGLRQKLGETMPAEAVLRRYHELGGRLVTIGSDSHRADDLGKGVDEGIDLLKAAGFTEFTVYERRRAIMLPLK